MRDPHDPSFSRNNSPARSWPGAQPSSPARHCVSAMNCDRCGRAATSSEHYRFCASCSLFVCDTCMPTGTDACANCVEQREREEAAAPPPAPPQRRTTTTARRAGASGAAAKSGAAKGGAAKGGAAKSRAAKRRAARTKAASVETANGAATSPLINEASPSAPPAATVEAHTNGKAPSAADGGSADNGAPEPIDVAEPVALVAASAEAAQTPVATQLTSIPASIWESIGPRSMGTMPPPVGAQVPRPRLQPVAPRPPLQAAQPRVSTAPRAVSLPSPRPSGAAKPAAASPSGAWTIDWGRLLTRVAMAAALAAALTIAAFAFEIATSPGPEGAVRDSRSSIQEQPSARPSAPAAQGRSYTVRSGDTLRSLARRFYGSEEKWRRIYLRNRDELPNPESLRVGQVLIIPAG